MRLSYLTVVLVCFSSLPAAHAEAPKPIAFRVGRLHPVSSPPIEKAVLLIVGNKIADVGKQGESG